MKTLTTFILIAAFWCVACGVMAAAIRLTIVACDYFTK